MKASTLLIALAGLAAINPANADADNGQVLHDEKCTHCHESMFGDTHTIYTREKRRMRNYPQLRGMVENCNAQIGSQLFPDELDDIAEYLNRDFYKFAKAANN